MSNLHDWIFHYNVYTKKWEGVIRDNYAKLFSDQNSNDILRSSKIETLIEIIEKTNGDEKAISKLITN